jgi:hypothetical protein
MSRALLAEMINREPFPMSIREAGMVNISFLGGAGGMQCEAFRLPALDM